MRLTQRHLPVFSLATVILASCLTARPAVGPDIAVSDDPKVEEMFREARDLFDKGDAQAADKAFAALIGSHAKDPLAKVAVIYRARIAIAKGDFEAARALLKLPANGSDLTAERARFYDGVALFGMGKYSEAIEKLEPFVGRLTDAEENLLLLDSLWRSAEALGDAKQAILRLDSYLSFDPPEDKKTAAMSQVASILNDVKDIDLLKEIVSKLDKNGKVWPIAKAREIRILYDANKLEEADAALKDAKKQRPESDPAIEEMAQMVERRISVDLTSLGCIAPLSGRARLVGDAVLKGVLLGAKTANPDDEQKLSVAIRDSGDDSDRTVKAVEELVLKERVAAIIGPVDVKTAPAAARRAEELGVPMLLLSVKEGAAKEARFVFRPFQTNSAEVKALISEAERLGHRSFAILWPNGGYGKSMRDLFAAELSARGLDVSADVQFDDSKKSFVEEAEKLSLADFDAVFVPAQPDRIALIAPALAAAGIWSSPAVEPGRESERSVQLLIPSIGFSQDLVRRAGRYLQGALFAVYFNKDASPGATDFHERFKKEYGSEPTYLGAFGYDAAMLAAGAIIDGAKTRDSIRKWLSESTERTSESLPLSTPFAGFSPKGEPLALPHLLKLTENNFEVAR